MTTAMAEQSWLTHSPKPRDTLPPAPSNLEGELLNLEGEQPLSQSLNSYGEGKKVNGCEKFGVQLPISTKYDESHYLKLEKVT